MVPGVWDNFGVGYFQTFGGGAYGGGNLGIRHSAWTLLYPHVLSMTWCDFYNRKRDVALYYGNHDAETRVCGLHFELRPYSKTAVTKDAWPSPKDLPSGEPIGSSRRVASTRSPW